MSRERQEARIQRQARIAARERLAQQQQQIRRDRYASRSAVNSGVLFEARERLLNLYDTVQDYLYFALASLRIWVRDRGLPRLAAVCATAFAAVALGAGYEGFHTICRMAGGDNNGRIEGLIFPRIPRKVPLVHPTPRVAVATPSPSPSPAVQPAFRFQLHVQASPELAGHGVIAGGKPFARPCPFSLVDEAARAGYALPGGKTNYVIEKSIFVPDSAPAVQAKTTTPLSLSLVFDQSGSINGNDSGNQRIPAACMLLNKLPGMRATILSYPAQPELYEENNLSDFFLPTATVKPTEPITKDGVCLAHTPMTDNKKRLLRAIKTLANRSNGAINQLYDSTLIGIARLSKEPGTRRHVLINFSDGDDIGSRFDENDVIAAAKKANINLYFVALGSLLDTSRMERMATATGGRVVSAADGDALEKAFMGLAEDIRPAEPVTGHWELIVRATREPGAVFARETLRVCTDSSAVPPQSFAVETDPARVFVAPTTSRGTH